MFITCKIYFEKRTSKLKQNNYETLILTVVNFFTSTLTQGQMRKKTKQHYIHTVQTLNFIYALEMK